LYQTLNLSETWLAVRKKLMDNTCFSDGTQKKAKNTWLAGKVKCGNCGAGLMSTPAANKVIYFRCRKRADSKSCERCRTLRAFDVEYFIYEKC